MITNTMKILKQKCIWYYRHTQVAKCAQYHSAMKKIPTIQRMKKASEQKHKTKHKTRSELYDGNRAQNFWISGHCFTDHLTVSFCSSYSLDIQPAISLGYKQIKKHYILFAKLQLMDKVPCMHS